MIRLLSSSLCNARFLSANRVSKFATSQSTESRRQLGGLGNFGRRTKHFKDSVIIRVTGGRGGDGCTSFEGRSVGKETPDGGHGGRGGDVILVARKNVRDFSHFSSFHYVGKDGKNGSGQGKTGRKGEDLELVVPVGTCVYRAGPSRKERQEIMGELDGGIPPSSMDALESRLLCDLSQPDQTFTVARGGLPGKGNLFQATQKFQDQRPLSAQQRQGREGTMAALELRLKSVADACLVGYPNAGKSSLLGAVSHSRPKVAPYPFTTLHPFIGLIEYSDAKRISLADLPGLVDGAAQNRGMGHTFLQHVERCKVLVFVLDGAPEAHEKVGENSIQQDLNNLVTELELYMPGLSERPSLVLINKMDRTNARERVQLEIESVRDALPSGCDGEHIFTVSARDGTGLENFVVALRQVVEAADSDTSANEDASEERPQQFKQFSRIGRAVAGRRALLHRIKRREATHGEQPEIITESQREMTRRVKRELRESFRARKSRKFQRKGSDEDDIEP